MSTRYSASQARQHLSELLDAAERGEKILIERHGVRFSLQTQRRRRRRGAKSSLISFVDPAVDSGQFSWRTGEDRVKLVRR